MGVLVSTLISRTRAIFNDGLADHFTQDDVSDQVDGVNVRFKALNQQIVAVAEGAPSAPALYINGTAVSGTMNQATGIFTAAAAPAAGSLASLEYYFVLVSDADYLSFAQMAAEFVGLSPTLTAATQDSTIGQLLEAAAVKYMHSLAAKKMANLSSWYYNAGASGRSFNKDQIAAKFTATATEELQAAIRERDGVYTRQGQRQAPASRVTRAPFPSYTPPR